MDNPENPTNEILNPKKLGSEKMEMQDLSIDQLLATSLRLVQAAAVQKNILIRRSIDVRVEFIYGDLRQLQYTLVELLANAIRFSDANSKIGIQVSGYPEDLIATFSIWDQGRGLHAEDQQRLQQLVGQLDPASAQTGSPQGLASVARIARQHGGSLKLESMLGGGSTFTICLPWNPERTGRVRSDATPVKKTAPLVAKGRGGKILLVDDTQSTVLFVRDYLEKFGHTVLVAQDGLSGIATAQREHPDLILMDIQMPGIDGVETTRRLREIPTLRHTPVIAITALAMPGDRERCLPAGMDDYISKPVSMRQVLDRIDEHLRSHRTPDD